MIKKFFKILLRLIEIFEFGYRKRLLKSPKIVSELKLKNVEILTESSWKPVSKVFQTKPFDVYELTLIKNKKISHQLKCADNHLVWHKSFIWEKSGRWEYVSQIEKGSYVMTKDGWCEVYSCYFLNHQQQMFDVEVESENHSYYSNDILSHNTTTAAIFVAWYMIFNHEKHAIYVSKTFKDAKEVLNKTKSIIENLPFFMKPGVTINNEHKLAFDNGCSITAVPTTKAAGVGHTLNLLYMDEFAHIPPGFVNDFYENAIPTLAQDPNSKLIITSTPKGYNKFYEIWKGATEQIDKNGLGRNKFKGVKIDWWEVPGRDEDWKEVEVQRLGSLESFNEQYGNQFLTSSKLLLEGKTMEKFKDNEKIYIQRDFDLLENNNLNYPITFHPDFDVEQIRDDKNRYVISIDVGEGTGEDYSAISGFQLKVMSEKELEDLGDYKSIYDIFKLEQVFKFTNNKIDPKEFAKFGYILLMEILNPEHIKVVLEWNALGQSFYNSIYLVYPEKNEMFDEIFVKFKHRANDKVSKIGLRYTGKDTKNFWALNFRDSALKNRIMANEKETVEQFSFFGKTDKKGYHGQTGNDDLAINGINAAAILDTQEWFDLIDDYVESLDDEERDYLEEIIQKKLEFYDEESDESFIDLFSEDSGGRETYFED